MKALISAAVMLLAIQQVQAQEQIEQGVYSLSGGIVFSSTTNEQFSMKQELMDLVVSPGISVFLLDNVELRFLLSYGRSKSTHEYTSYYGTTKTEFFSTRLSADLGLRFYVGLGKAALFLGAAGGASWTKNAAYYPGDVFTPPTKTWFFEGGVDIFLAEPVALEPSIQYGKTEYEHMVLLKGYQAGIGIKYFIL